ncbi:hypothetical protein A2783_02390 [Microgenomates group bacterium RIFCSPHIGHO2_01_FULL_45_11]|nr:MAG: hypothetical protein A2783_02390 [Microgenomates group bacterium RIFCSPHIGHO2_01_FULL_45_11]
MPNDNIWPSGMGNNYIIELDMWMVDGIDHNVAFRFNPGTSQGHYYEVHFQSPDFVNLAIPQGSSNRRINYPVPNKSTPYHLKIIVDNGLLELSIDNNLVVRHEYSPLGEIAPTGRFALRAGTGVIPISVTYFDNINITSIPEPRPIHYLSQTDPLWENETYDSTNYTISDLGCALASAAMVLNYWNLTPLPDGSTLTPLSLNQWLVDNDGYDLNGNLNFYTIANLSEEITNIASQSGTPLPFESLEYYRFDTPFSSIEYENLVDDFINQNHPLIFKESAALSSSGNHFVVANQVITSGQEYGILDPINVDRNRFNQPPDQLLSVRYLAPSFTNLSGLLIQTNEAVDLTITDPDNHSADKNQNAIPDSHYQYSLPIANYNNPQLVSGQPIWEFDKKHPASGHYQITLSAVNPGWYDFWLFAYNQNGQDWVYKQKVLVGNQPSPYQLNYDQESETDFADLNKIVTFQSLTNDITTLNQLNLLDLQAKNILTKNLETINKLYQTNFLAGQHLLSVFITKLEAFTPSLIDPQATLYLTEETQLLENSLANAN